MKRGPKQTNDVQSSSKKAKHSTAANKQRPIIIDQLPINKNVFQSIVFNYLNNKDVARFQLLVVRRVPGQVLHFKVGG